MSTCAHIYGDDPDRRCPHQATPGNTRCIWHNQTIKKSDLYVALLLEQAIDLIGTDLSDFQLAGLQWPAAALAEKCLAGANLRDAHLPGANLHRTDLHNAVLRRANLSRANLQDANLSEADLRMANLHGADLRGAVLQRAQLDDSILIGADLRDADLEGATLQNFVWNRRTRFAGVRGLDADLDFGEGDATQLFAAPMAMADHLGLSASAADFYDPELDRTHVYRIGEKSKTPQQAPPAPDETMQAVPEGLAAGAKAAPHPIRRPNRTWFGLLAASLMATLMACGFGVWAYTQMLDLKQDLLTERRRGSEQGPTEIDDSAWRERLTEKNSQVQSLMEEIANLRQVMEQRELAHKELHTARQEQQLTIARLRTREDEAAAMRLVHKELKREHLALLNTNQRLHDTARILRQGLDQLQEQRDELAVFKQNHLTDYYNYNRLQGEVDEFRQQNQKLTSKNKSLQLVNDSLQQNLREAEQSLKTFLAHIEGSRLKEFLHSDNAEEPLIPITLNKPMVFGGEYLVTLRVEPGERDNQVRTSLVVQRPANKQLPDINLLLYDSNGRPLRSVSYSFPAGNGNTPFAATQTTLSCPRFPTALRLLVNPGLDPSLVARRE
jgi:uncharacterized protein YjbI with pentapeptide repeats